MHLVPRLGAVSSPAAWARTTFPAVQVTSHYAEENGRHDKRGGAHNFTSLEVAVLLVGNRKECLPATTPGCVLRGGQMGKDSVLRHLTRGHGCCAEGEEIRTSAFLMLAAPKAHPTTEGGVTVVLYVYRVHM